MKRVCLSYGDTYDAPCHFGGLFFSFNTNFGFVKPKALAFFLSLVRIG